MSPNAHIIAGPNGVGKTTFAREFLPDSWSLFDNSGATPIVIAFEKQGEAHIMEREIYNELVVRYGET